MTTTTTTTTTTAAARVPHVDYSAMTEAALSAACQALTEKRSDYAPASVIAAYKRMLQAAAMAGHMGACATIAASISAHKDERAASDSIDEGQRALNLASNLVAFQAAVRHLDDVVSARAEAAMIKLEGLGIAYPEPDDVRVERFSAKLEDMIPTERVVRAERVAIPAWMATVAERHPKKALAGMTYGELTAALDVDVRPSGGALRNAVEAGNCDGWTHVQVTRGERVVWGAIYSGAPSAKA